MVENRTDAPATIGVRVEDDEGTRLFSRVYDLDPGHLDSSAGIEPTPATITAFTPTGTAATWDYTPDLDMECAGPDIGLTLKADGTIDDWYAC